MFKSLKFSKSLALGLSIVSVFLLFCGVSAGVQAGPVDKIQEKMAGISEEEKEILERLFILSQEIEMAEREENRLNEEIETVKGEVEKLESAIEADQAAYEKKREGLRQVLATYQRMGPGSYLEILLDSDNLTEFIRRLNTLRDLTRDTGELLNELEESSKKLNAEKSKLAGKLGLLERNRLKAKEALEKKLELKGEEEAYLSSLKGEKEFYRKYLAEIQQRWEELKAIFKEADGEFSGIIEKGSLPQDALKISFSFFEIKGTIAEKAFNEVISGQPDLPEMIFDFQPGKAELSLPEQKLTLTGSFVVLEGHILKFQPQEGYFYGMPLEPGSIEELLSEGDLSIDLKPLLGKNTLQSAEVKEEQLELSIKLNLF